MIEGGSEVVERIPENEKKFVGERLGRSDAEHIISGIRVCFDRDRVGVSIAEELRRAVKLIDVMLGPFNL
jgi:hypothetical protein